MIAVAISFAAVFLAALSLIAWLVVRTVSGTEKQADARVAQNDTEGHLERAKFELEQTTRALAATKKRAAKLEELLSHALENPDAVAAAPDDWRARVRLLTKEWAAAEDGRDPVFAEPDGGELFDEQPTNPAAASTGVLVDPFVEPVP